MDDLEHAGAECVQELASALLMAAGNAMKRHGNDPNSRAIVAAGFAMAIQKIGQHIDPQMSKVVCKLLAK